MSIVDSIGIRELRQHASRYVAMVKAGRRIQVTERGRPVAYLVPAEAGGSMLERLEAAGEYRPGVGNVLDAGPPVESDAPLSQALADLRDEERW